MAPTRSLLGTAFWCKEVGKKAECTQRLFHKIDSAMRHHLVSVYCSKSEIDISKACSSGQGLRAIHVEYIGGAWQFDRRWSDCPLGLDYGGSVPVEFIESEAKVVIQVKRWLLQGLR
jgi:hypothetical protein